MLASRGSCLVYRAMRSRWHDVRRGLLSAQFSLNDEWRQRHAELKKLALGGHYEWIAAVQKKFAGGGIASAVDVDAAVCGGEEKDHLEDVVELAYKLRHTSNTAGMLPSTEYALLRALLLHDDVSTLFTVLNDPINYGIFFNEHSACLAVDYFLKSNNIVGAAKVASIVMRQEMFSCELLNLLCVYSALKWCELPTAERKFDVQAVSSDAESDHAYEDEVKTFKFPFLKNEYFDGHFDLTDANQLVGKTLMWTGRETTLDAPLQNSVLIVGSVFMGDFSAALSLLSSGKVFSSAISLCKSRIEQLSSSEPQGEDAAAPSSSPLLDKVLSALEECSKCESTASLSEMVKARFDEVREVEEKKIMDQQRAMFTQWNTRRSALIRSQAERLNYQVRLEEIAAERRSLADRKEMMNFFEKRLEWENRADENDKLFAEFAIQEKQASVSEKEYSLRMFEDHLKLKQTAKK